MLPTSHPDPESSPGRDFDTEASALLEAGAPSDGDATGQNAGAVPVVRRRSKAGSEPTKGRNDPGDPSGRADPPVPHVVPLAATAVSVPLVLAVVAVLLGVPAVVLGFSVALGSLVSGVVIIAAIVRPLTRTAVTAVIRQADAERALADELDTQRFRDRLDRALRSSQSEPTTIGICLRAVSEVLPESEVSLLLNLPGEATIGWRVDLVDGRLKPAVPVPGGPTCVGLATLTTAVSTSSTKLDACGHLSESNNDVSGVCVPLLLGERTLGSVSATSAPGEVPSLDQIRRVEWVIERAAVRVAEQRLQRGPSVAGRPDPVTGLPGPSALRNQLRDLVRTLSPFCVSTVSIDSFDQIQYRAGEDAADQVLGLAADALCSTLRPDDLICRIDGPRFAVVFADCGARQATAAMERFRESLALQLSLEEDVVPFTCSAGLVESHRATSLESLIELSARACDEAEAAGGNRVAQSYEH